MNWKNKKERKSGKGIMLSAAIVGAGAIAYQTMRNKKGQNDQRDNQEVMVDDFDNINDLF